MDGLAELNTKYESLKQGVHTARNDAQRAVNQSELNKMEIGHVKVAVEEVKETMATKEQMEFVTQHVKEVRSALVFIGGPVILVVLYAVLDMVIKK